MTQSPRQAAPKTSHGPLHAVTCPHCGHHNDMRELPQQQLLDTGSTYTCDGCLRLMEVVGIQTITVVTVRPVYERAIAAAAAQPALGARVRRFLKR